MVLSTVFDLICSFFSTCQGYLVSVWEVFFFNTRVLYSSDTVMMATPLLFVLLVAWRIFGPDDQTNSIAMQGYEANEPHTLVNDRTYAGGGNYSGHTRTGAADQTTSTNKKDDWCSSWWCGMYVKLLRDRFIHFRYTGQWMYRGKNIETSFQQWMIQSFAIFTCSFSVTSPLDTSQTQFGLCAVPQLTVHVPMCVCVCQSTYVYTKKTAGVSTQTKHRRSID